MANGTDGDRRDVPRGATRNVRLPGEGARPGHRDRDRMVADGVGVGEPVATGLRLGVGPPLVLVSTSWLAAHAGDEGLAVVDLRWRPDGSGRARYERGHIPGAVFCDWATDLVDPDHPVAFMLAGPERFALLMRRLGIDDDSAVVAYAAAKGSGAF